MSWKMNLTVAVAVAMVLPAVANGAWQTCPGTYAYQACDAGTGTDTCYWVGGATNQIECYGSTSNDVFYVVEENSSPWAYGTKAGTAFCCSSAEMGNSSGVHVRMEMELGDDIVCLSDHNGPAGCTAVAGSPSTGTAPPRSTARGAPTR